MFDEPILARWARQWTRGTDRRHTIAVVIGLGVVLHGCGSDEPAMDGAPLPGVDASGLLDSGLTPDGDLTRDGGIVDARASMDSAPVSDASQVVDALPPSDSAFEGLSIPDPGTQAASWEADYEQNFTPQTAYPVGIVTQNNPYVLAYIEPTSGDVFYVFRTGPNFDQLNIDLFGNKANVLSMHVHSGAGLVFGAKVPDNNPTILLGDWQLQTDAIYVLEIRTLGGGFV